MIGAIASTAVQPHMAVPTVSNMELSRLTPNQRQIRGIARPATSRQPSTTGAARMLMVPSETSASRKPISAMPMRNTLVVENRSPGVSSGGQRR